MPATFPPLDRRTLLTGALAWGSAALWGNHTRAGSPQENADVAIPLDPSRLALLADTHINEDPRRVVLGTKWPGTPYADDEHEGVNMADSLARVVADVLACRPRPAHVVVNGDCAHTSGRAGEYREFARLIAPLRQAGIAVHVTIGNHDDRVKLWEIVPDLKQTRGGVHVGVVELPGANLFLLDSGKGDLLSGQLDWLRGELESRADRPALVFFHYNPYPHGGIRPDLGLRGEAGIQLLVLMEKFKHAKACLYGHTHEWKLRTWGPLHLVNLPCVGYYFGKGDPHGWLDMRLSGAGADVTLRCVDPRHPLHDQRHALAWRPA